MKLDFNDLVIVPVGLSDITSRTQVDPYIYAGSVPYYLPLIAAPMDTVVSEKNQFTFFRNRIESCMPRKSWGAIGFQSYSINEIEFELEIDRINEHGKYLIDVANGHMSSVLDITKKLKSKYPYLSLMVGNVASPEAYLNLSNAGADYIRIGIGNGGGCLTTQNTGVGYPMASLIKECYQISLTLQSPAAIVADGGMQGYSDIIKALALGADYVMVGSIFNKAIESAGENYLWKRIKISQDTAEKLYKRGFTIYKKFRGMSTKEVQKKWGCKELKTSEGVSRFRKVEYTLPQWIENFESYLRSAMSYTGAHNLKEFIGNVDLVEITDNAYKRFNK